jgi:hypothetical protein
LFGGQGSVLTPSERVRDTQRVSEQIYQNASPHSVEMRQIVNPVRESNYVLPVNNLAITLTALTEINTKIYNNNNNNNNNNIY